MIKTSKSKKFQPKPFDTDGVSVFNFEAQFLDFMKLDFNFQFETFDTD